MSQWQIYEDAEIKENNAIALEIAEKEKLPVNDLHDVILRYDFSKCLIGDGCHMTDSLVEVIRALI